MAHSYAKANRKRYFVSIVIPLRVCTSAHSEDQKECQQYFNPHRLCRGHTGAWDCRTQGSAFLVRCDIFQYCWASNTLLRIERCEYYFIGQCEFVACLSCMSASFYHYYKTGLCAQRRFKNGPQSVQNPNLRFLNIYFGLYNVLCTQKLHHTRSFVCHLVNGLLFRVFFNTKINQPVIGVMCSPDTEFPP